jgi:hypothetical protein
VRLLKVATLATSCIQTLFRIAYHLSQIHGWPDISAGWRYQIPVLLELGCRVVVPDMMGYGGTVCMHHPPPDSVPKPD